MTVPKESQARGSQGFPGGLRTFSVIWLAQLVAKVANGLTPFALSIYVYQQTGLSTSIALITLAGFLPAVLLAPFAGILADRFDRKNLMLLSNALFAVCLGSLLAAICFTHGNIALICLALAAGSAATAPMDPAYRSIVTDLLTPDQYTRAAGLVQIASAAQFLFSPVIAGLLMPRISIVGVILVDSGLTVAVAICMVLVKAPKNRTEFEGEWSIRSDLRSGLQFLRTSRGVIVLLTLVTIATFCMGFLQTLLTPLLLDLTTEENVGLIRSTAAVGMLVSSLFIGLFNVGTRHVRHMSCALVVSGVVALLGTTTSIFLIGVYAFIFFLTLPPLNTSVEVLARTAIPNHIQGKIWGLVGFISQFGYIAAYALSGVLADYIFNPLLREDGPLTASVFGTVFGIGPSRGIGLIFAIIGLSLMCIGLILPRLSSLRSIEYSLTESVRKTQDTAP